MPAIIGGLLRGFGASFADTKKEKNREKLERERMAKQDAQFQQSLALQREQIAATNARNERLDAFMFKRGDKEDTRLDQDAQQKAELHVYNKKRLRGILGDVNDDSFVQKQQKASTAELDAQIATNEATLRRMPIEDRRALLREENEKIDNEIKSLAASKGRRDLDQATKLEPYEAKMRELQSKIVEAQARKVDFDTAPERLQADEFIRTTRERFGLVADIARIADAAEERKLKALHLNAEQLDAVGQRYDKLVGAFAQIPGTTPEAAKKLAKDLILESYTVGHAAINKPLAQRWSGGDPVKHGERMRWFADASRMILEGDPAQAAALGPQMKQVMSEAVKALSDYGTDEKDDWHPPMAATEEGAAAPKVGGFTKMLEGLKGRGVSEAGARTALKKQGVRAIPVGDELHAPDNSALPKDKKSDADTVDKWAESDAKFTPTFEAFIAAHGGEANPANYERFKKWIVDGSSKFGGDIGKALNAAMIELKTLDYGTSGRKRFEGKLGAPPSP